MITDPWFYVVAIPAVLLFGISKGGFGGGLGTASVPLMALVVSPVQAAAILLPILCVMDLVAVWKFRRKWSWPELRVLLPASLVGVAVGTLLFEYMSTAVVKLIVGLVAVTFTVHHWAHRWAGRRVTAQAQQSYFPRNYGLLGGAVAGFTSFVAHAGGPPINMYLLRRPLDRTDFAATAILFFAVVNYVKLIPYAWLGQFSADNLATSAALMILAPIGVLTGAWLHARISDRSFFLLVYVLLFVVGLKLVFDGVSALL